MGMNYYARILPSSDKVSHFKETVSTNDFDAIMKECAEIYGPLALNDNNEFVGGVVHLGKKSAGWKFLWNPNVYVIRHGHMEKKDNEVYKFVQDPSELKYLYELTEQGIYEFIRRADVVISNENGETVDTEEFIKITQQETYKDLEGKEHLCVDLVTYYKEHPHEHKSMCANELTLVMSENGFKFADETKAEFYSDGMRFSSSTEFS